MKKQYRNFEVTGVTYPVEIFRVESIGGAEWGAGSKQIGGSMSFSPLQKDLELEVELVEEERRCARVCGAGLAGAVRGLLCSQLRGSSSSWFDPSTKHTHPVYRWNNYSTHLNLWFSQNCLLVIPVLCYTNRELWV